MNTVEQVTKSQPSAIVRVGDNYEKEVVLVDIKGRAYTSIIRLGKQTLIDTIGGDAVKRIPYYDASVIVPLHLNYQSVFGSCINRYYPLGIRPQQGDFATWRSLISHVFGAQEEMGWDYIQLLFNQPTQTLPILCLVSQENHTGKSTFCNGLSFLFGLNVGFFGQDDLSSQFNVWIKCLVAVFEEISETKTTLNRLKNQSTAKTATLNQKHQPQVTFQPFVKIIICSNNEKTFIKANENDIRYWVRKVGKIQNFDADFDVKLQQEAPAMLSYLSKRMLSTKRSSRMWFSPEDICTDALKKVVKESRSKCAKDIEIVIDDRLQQGEGKSFFANLTELSELLQRKYSPSEIQTAIREELHYPKPKQQRYTNYMGEAKSGKPYVFISPDTEPPPDESNLPF